jgi:hypothetical protein
MKSIRSTTLEEKTHEEVTTDEINARIAAMEMKEFMHRSLLKQLEDERIAADQRFVRICGWTILGMVFAALIVMNVLLVLRL